VNSYRSSGEREYVSLTQSLVGHKVDGTLHHLISYYIQWDTVNGLLKSPTRLLDFQDTILRNELAAQENMQSLSPMEQFRLDLEV